MCELLGLSFEKPVQADFSFHKFAPRDEQNADGWGLAWYPDRSVAVVKEPLSWRQSKHIGFLETYANLRSPLYIGHVRRRTTGGTPTHADTHPFTRERDGRDYAFAHNGTLEHLRGNVELTRYHPIGSTDSEYVFCHLLDEMTAAQIALDREAGWNWLHEKLLALNRLGKLNCLLSDGEYLAAYHDANGHKGLARRFIEIHQDQKHQFDDSEVSIELEGELLNRGFVIATHPLSANGWQPFVPGELAVLSRGELRYSSHSVQHAADAPSASATTNGSSPAGRAANKRVPDQANA